jgi:Tol biopolymer transport system component
VRPLAAAGTAWRKLGASHDGDVSLGFWSVDGRTIYFNTGIKATRQLMALDVASNTVRRVTERSGGDSTRQRDEESRKIVLQYSDPRQPPVHFVVDEPAAVANRDAWRQVTDANPQAKEFALGDAEEICWKSKSTAERWAECS